MRAIPRRAIPRRAIPRAALVVLVLAAAAGCERAGPNAASAAGLDSLNARLEDAYRRRDTVAYAALYTDSAVFEWPAIDPVRGPAALGAMAGAIWAPQRDVALRVRVTARHVGAAHGSEFGAFEQDWRDTAGVRWTEYGRYASVAVRGADGRWRLHRWLGFEDSTRRARP